MLFRKTTHLRFLGVPSVALLGFLLLSGPAASQTQDALPFGSISFFDLQSCPSGWQALTIGAGRLFIGVPPSFGISGQVNEPLTSQEHPNHNHGMSSSINVDGTSYALVDGCCNPDLGSAGNHGFSGSVESESTGLPYIQYLACLKSTSPPAVSDTIPPGLLMYFGVSTCPQGWSEALTHEGRFLVSLPPGGSAGASFGGESLGDLEDRTHTHAFSGNVSTSSQQIAGASGCCADGYAKNGTYGYSGTTDSGSSGLPYIQFLVCEKD